MSAGQDVGMGYFYGGILVRLIVVSNLKSSEEKLHDCSQAELVFPFCAISAA